MAMCKIQRICSFAYYAILHMMLESAKRLFSLEKTYALAREGSGVWRKHIFVKSLAFFVLARFLLIKEQVSVKAASPV